MVLDGRVCSTKADARGGRFELVDGTRGLAAFAVVLPHAVGLFQLCLFAMGLALSLRPELPRVFGFLTVVVISATRRDAMHRWLLSPSVQCLGRISYSIYRVHVPVVALFLGLRTRVALDSKLVSLVCRAAAHSLTLVLASLLHLAVEVPRLRLSQRLKRWPVASGARVREALPA